jgi:hypothetical protein
MIKIKNSEKNTNKHTEKGLMLLENSINTVGVIESISVAKDGTIISGHARKSIFEKNGKVAKEIHLKENEYPVIVTDIEPESKQYYEAQIYANTTAKNNFNLDSDLIDELAEEFDLDIIELGVEVMEDTGDYFDVDDDSGTKNVDKPSTSDNDYSTFELVMLHENKLILIETLNKIKNNFLFEKQEEALMELVRHFNK